MTAMIPRRLNLNSLIWYPMRRYSSKLPPDEPPAHENETKESEIENKTKSSEASDKIKRLLQGMIEDKNKLETNKALFESKIPYEDIGIKGKPRKLKPEKEQLQAMKEAARQIVENLGDEAKEAESEILSKAIDGPKRIDLDWKQFIAGMAIDNTSEVEGFSRAQEVKAHLQGRKPTKRAREDQRGQSETISSESLFNGEPMGIFTKPVQPSATTTPVLKTWEYLQNKDLELTVAQPPSNYFQKMILWTNQGKIWKFPINNEQGLEKENEVHFSDHIFLETHLEGWCPDKGPVRQFMEMVCVGLSKNPYVTVADKIDHILWFKDYFESKKNIFISHGIWHNQEKSAEKMEA